MSRLFRLFIILLITASLSLIGCSKKNAGNYAHLDYIPADTPYAFVSLKPLPDDIREMYAKSYDGLFKVYSRIATESYQDYIERAKQQQRSNDETGVEIETKNDIWDNNWVKALKEEFSGEFTLAKLNDFGIDKNSLYALYGNGILPVLRIGLSDTQLFIDAIERIEKTAEDEIPEHNIDGLRVWSISDKDSDDGELIIAVDKHDLIVSFLPEGSTTSMLEQLLGKQKPQQTLADSKNLQKIMQEKSYLPESVGFIDLQQVLNRFINEPTGLDKEFLALFDDLETKRDEISATCKAELKEVVNTMPRILFGATELSSNRMRVESLIEVRSDIANEMTELTAPVPGLGQAAGLFSMGFSMDIPAMRAFAIKRIESLQANPYECEHLEIEEEKLEKMLAAVKNPAAGFVESVHGMNFVLDDVDVDAFMELINSEDGAEGIDDMDIYELKDLMAEKFSAFAVLAADNPKTMVNMGKMLSPELAGLNIKADGKAISINELFPEPVPFDVYAAMNDKALTFAMGKSAKKNSERVLDLPTTDIEPLLSYSIDVEKYLSLFTKIMQNPKVAEAFEDEEELSLEELESILTSVMGLTGKATININLRDDGVVFEQDMLLK